MKHPTIAEHHLHSVNLIPALGNLQPELLQASGETALPSSLRKMHDLRRQALESGKTSSRKAQSNRSSRNSSAANSRINSRNVSRHGSDDEEADLSDETSWSVTSADDAPENGDSSIVVPKESLNDVLAYLQDWKRSNGQKREEYLATCSQIILGNYAEAVDGPLDSMISVFLKCVKSGSEREIELALKGLIGLLHFLDDCLPQPFAVIALTVITSPSQEKSETVIKPLQNVISDPSSPRLKAAAIHSLGIATFYADGPSEEIEDVMAFLLAIVETDGESVDAIDSSLVVTAALEEWGFLATVIDDMEDDSPEMVDAFTEQLDSTEASVQIAAGENIALAYEKSYTEQEDGEDIRSNSDPDSDDEVARTDAPKRVKRYDASRHTYQLKQKLSSLATIASKRYNKKDKKSLHSNFADILHSVTNPTKGPRYKTAIDNETGKQYGSRMMVRINKTGSMKIDAWWKLLRLKALRRLLGGGFLHHYEHNDVIFDTLPIMITKDEMSVRKTTKKRTQFSTAFERVEGDYDE